MAKLKKPGRKRTLSKTECERRFLVDIRNIPVSLETCNMVYITQGYLKDKKGTRVREEINGHRRQYLTTVKSGSGVARLETERSISMRSFLRMWKKVSHSLTKSRYYVPLRKPLFAEVNIFHGALCGYVQLEVEFKSLKAALAFKPPRWFGAEVTHDKRHGNYRLARDGVPSPL